ncbi:MAG: SDR family oxidoreductase [Chloroflexales bacterium]|nr:SDR family oxidoreductase [Chloroflexales bacterium]
MALKGRIAIITGASGGVGYATARLFARQGAVVVAVARDRDRLEWLVGEIAAEGLQGVSLPTDVTDPVQVQRMVDQTMRLLGRIDVLINGVGAVLKLAPLEQFADADWNYIIQTNLTSIFYTTRAVIPHMKNQHSGTILNIGARIGKQGIANFAPLCAAKFGITGLSQALAQELRPYNIFVTTVFAGMINPDIHPLNPVEGFRRQPLSADDVAQAILWACTLPPSLRVDELPLMPRQLDM